MSLPLFASAVVSLWLAGPGNVAEPSPDAATTTAEAGPWLGRFLPARGQWELGALTGLTILGARHDYYDPDTAPQVKLGRVAPVAGLRAAYFPLSFVGVEAEGWGLWTKVPARGDAPAFVYGLGGHAILQLPMYRLVPFVLGGYGITGVRSSRDAVGSDVDPAGHYGAGLKLMVDGRFAVRLEGRHTMTPARARQRQVANHISILLGISIRLGPEPARGRPPRAATVAPGDHGQGDADGDQVRDRSDACPRLAGVFPDGCPQLDYDADGIPDAVDACPTSAGQDDGCPVKDTDHDGRPDGEDRCPWERGVDPDGCIAPPSPVPVTPAVEPQGST